MVSLSSVIINDQHNPVGIQSVQQIGWKIHSDQRNVLQLGYHLQLASDKDFQDLLYDSGIVTSEESAHIDGSPLNENLVSAKKYFLRVRVDTTVGQTGWAYGAFATALLDPAEWKGKFITVEKEEDSAKSKGTCLRKEIRLRNPVRSAFAFTTALGLYQFYINGKKVGYDEFTPGWTSYNKHLLYQAYDVTSFLHPGHSTLGCMLGAGWYKGDIGFNRVRNYYGKYTAFSCHLAVEYEDGSQEIFCTDDTWEGADSPIVFSEIYDGEIYDARLEISGWNKNHCTSGNWIPVRTLPFNKKVLTAQAGAKVCRKDCIPAKEIFTTPQGDRVIDFGQNLTGWIEFIGQGHTGDRIELHCFEILDHQGNVYTDNLRTAKSAVTYICRDDEPFRFHENFSFQGFRYAKVVSWPGIPEKENFTAYTLHSDMEPTGQFECSIPEVNQLHHNVLWSMKGNFLDIPTDCPQRDERLGWTGDAQIFCRTAAYLMDCRTFFRKWLDDLVADQTEDGGVPHVVPDILIGNCAQDRLLKNGDHSASAWADVSVILPWTLYLMYGDTSVIRAQYQSMKSWIDYMHSHANGNIWNYRFQFGDWVALDAAEGSCLGATPNDLTCTAYYAYSTELFARMASVIGCEADSIKYMQLHNDIKKTYQETFFEDGHLTAQTQTAQILSLHFGLVPETYRQNVIEDLIRLLQKENGHLVTGFVGTPYFCFALSRNGHIKEAYELLLKEDFPSWLYQVKQGATTIWEHWDGIRPDGSMWSPDMNSFNHYAYGSIAEWLYCTVAGIDTSTEAPGFKKSVIAPHIGGGLKYVKSSYESVYGKIDSSWKTDGNTVTLDIQIPCNTSAQIRLINAAEVIADDGLSFQEVVSNTHIRTASAGSGTYRIIYKLQPDTD